MRRKKKFVGTRTHDLNSVGLCGNQLPGISYLCVHICCIQGQLSTVCVGPHNTYVSRSMPVPFCLCTRISTAGRSPLPCMSTMPPGWTRLACRRVWLGRKKGGNYYLLLFAGGTFVSIDFDFCPPTNVFTTRCPSGRDENECTHRDRQREARGA